MDDAIDPRDPAAIAADRLGDPDAVYAVSPGRFWAKVTAAAALIGWGAVGNAVAWQFGFWRLDHVTLLVFFAPAFTGVSLLRHLYVTRGLRVLCYPTGLLKVQGGAVEAYPWDEVAAVAVAADQGVPVVVSAGGDVTDAWVAVEPPVFRVAGAGVTVHRADGMTATLSPTLAGYADLAERVQRATFRVLWPAVRDHFAAGAPVGFGPVACDRDGVWAGNRGVAWADLDAVKVTAKALQLHGRKKKLVVPLDELPNPHVLAGLVEWVRLNGVPAAE